MGCSDCPFREAQWLLPESYKAIASEYAGFIGQSVQQAASIESFGDPALTVIGNNETQSPFW